MDQGQHEPLLLAALGARSGEPAPGRRWTVLLVTLAASVLLLSLPLALLGAVVVRTGQASLERAAPQRVGDPFTGLPDRPPPPPAGAGSGDVALNVLVVGSDSRVVDRRPDEWAAGQQRADTLLLLHLSADRRTGCVISIPRDAWVPVPGRGTTKINAAFSYGGPALMVHTVERLTRVRIDHYVAVDFDAFADLTDEVGGVLLPVAGGQQRLDGQAALAWVRERTRLPNGDLDRVRRQQAYLRAVLRELGQQADVRGPAWLARQVVTFSRHVAVDDALAAPVLTRVARSLAALEPDRVAFMTAPVAGLGRGPRGESMVRLDDQRSGALWRHVRQDDVASWVRDHEPLLPERVR